MATLVRFYIEQNPDNVLAVFPGICPTNDSEHRSCYSHVGQHSVTHPNYYRDLPLATREQYEPLQRELEQIGYVLKVLNKN